MTGSTTRAGLMFTPRVVQVSTKWVDSGAKPCQPGPSLAILILCYITESAATDKHTGCFTGQSKVVLEDGRQKNMSQLALGDKIQSVDSQGNLVYSEVLMFLDREPEERTRFVTLKTEDGAVLTLTASHLVYAGAPDCWDLQCMSPVYAGNVERGHNLLVREGRMEASTVLSVTSSHHTGVFAPLTRAGNLVVDGVLASCYAVIDSQSIAHAAFAPVRWYYSLAASLGGASEPRTVRGPPGVHWYPDILYRLARLVLPGHLVL